MIENPTFHLDAVVKSRDEMQNFEGPLNLILTLLSKNKIEIRDIKISLILEQYLEYLEEMRSMDLEIASEFVQMASHLLYIKTRTLLVTDEEPEELDILMTSLEQLRNRDTLAAVKAVTEELGAALAYGMRRFTKPPEIRERNEEYIYQITCSELLAAMFMLSSRSAAVPPDEQTERLIPKPIVYDVRGKSRELISALRAEGSIRLKELFTRCGSRSEVVATFIAILELCSIGSLALAFEDGETAASLTDDTVTELDFTEQSSFL